jgi:inhibitor of KinA sporulation pathway (predicted exonuclease)
MQNLSSFIVYDLEYTSWVGCNEIGWDESKNQFKEIVQIGAVRVDAETLKQIDKFNVLCKPSRNPVLSDYFTALTGIGNGDIAEAASFPDVFSQFSSWVGARTLFAYGGDFGVIELNCSYAGIANSIPQHQANNLRDLLAEKNFPVANYHSGNLSSYYGLENPTHDHSALGDAQNILRTLQEMQKRKEFILI